MNSIFPAFETVTNPVLTVIDDCDNTSNKPSLEQEGNHSMGTVKSEEEEVVGEDKDFVSFFDLGIFGGQRVIKWILETLELCE